MKKKIATKRISYSLSVLLLIMLLLPIQVHAATVTYKLNKTSITLCTNKTYTLKVTNTKRTVKWTSSNKTIATVNSKTGKVTAKKTGTAYVTAQIGSKKAKCKVVVKDHTWKRTSYKKATCTENGLKKYCCTRCKKTMSKKVSATGHDWDRTAYKKPTCKRTGYKKYTCTKCKETTTKKYPKAKHNWKTVSTEAKGHYEDVAVGTEQVIVGYKNVLHYICTDCGYTTDDGYAFMNHQEETWHGGNYEEEDRIPIYETRTKYESQWVVDEPATSYTKCSVCGAKK